nr:GNAT family N-acetyltransferase [Clostridia bacterium]
MDGEWQLLPIAFNEDWDVLRLRAEAADILRAIADGLPVIGAFDEEKLMGFAQLGEYLGSRGQYIELVSYHVSAPYRGQGIGRRLFAAICDAARSLGAEKLYISAHSSKESQAAYRALGCVPAQEVDAMRAANEPCDVQMEYEL